MSPDQYSDELYYSINNFKKIKKNKKVGLVDGSGKQICSAIYDEIGNFSCGLAPVKKGCYWGFIDESGKEVIKTIFNDVHNFQEDFAIVKKYGFIFFINKEGKQISKYYQNAYDYVNGFAKVSQNGLWGWIDKEGKEITGIIYDHVLYFVDGFSQVKIGEKYGFINGKGEKICDVKYNWIESFINGLSTFLKDGKYGLLDMSGNEILPAKFNNIINLSSSTTVTYMGEEFNYSNGLLIKEINFGSILLCQESMLYSLIDDDGKNILKNATLEEINKRISQEEVLNEERKAWQRFDDKNKETNYSNDLKNERLSSDVAKEEVFSLVDEDSFIYLFNEFKKELNSSISSLVKIFNDKESTVGDENKNIKDGLKKIGCQIEGIAMG